MIGFDKRSLQRIDVPVELKIIIGSDIVSGITRNVSKKGMCIEILTTSLKSGLLDKLDERVSVYIGDAVLYGLLRWYNVEDGHFTMGIKLERGSRARWWDVVGPVAEAHLSTA
jgi:hypothetical protein